MQPSQAQALGMISKSCTSSAVLPIIAAAEDRRVADALNALPERNRFMKGRYAWVGFKAAALPFVPHDRAGGQTSFSMRRLGSLAL